MRSVRNHRILVVIIVASSACAVKLPATSGEDSRGVGDRDHGKGASGETSKQIENRCGKNPLLSFTRTLIEDLNATVEFKTNIRTSFEACADADLDVSVANQSVAKAALEACVTKKITLDEKAKSTLMGLIDDSYDYALTTSPRTLAEWDACGANMIQCGTHPCPRCDDGKTEASERCDEGSDNGLVGHCKRNCQGYCGRAGDECCTEQACLTGLICVRESCVACGAEGQPCCSGDACDHSLTCASATCTVTPPTPAKAAARCEGNHILLPDSQPYQVTIRFNDFDGGGRFKTDLMWNGNFVATLPLKEDATRTFNGKGEISVGSKDTKESPWGKWPSCSDTGTGKLRISVGPDIMRDGHADFTVQ